MMIWVFQASKKKALRQVSLQPGIGRRSEVPRPCEYRGEQLEVR
jgi:hypothetical protein